MKLLFMLPCPDKDRGTVDYIYITSPTGDHDWRIAHDSFYEELAYELARHEAQFR